MKIRTIAAALPAIAALSWLGWTGARPAGAQDSKMDGAELVARHLQSIGAREKLAARKTCLAEGRCVMQNIRGPAEPMKEGPAVLVSDGKKYRLRIKFNYPTYPFENFAFDGKIFDAGFFEAGRRSDFSSFLERYNGIGKEGLLGGVLSTGWALADLAANRPKLQYRGVKSLNGKSVHELRYQMKKGQQYEMTITMLFDERYYRHLSTAYSVVHGTSVNEVLEAFDDFRETEGLTLPFHWIIHHTTQTEKDVTVTEWNVSFTSITLNRPIDPKVFIISY